MIRLKKKIIRLRKNPWEIDDTEKPLNYFKPETVSFTLISILEHVFLHASPVYFSNLVSLWVQGSHCFDHGDRPIPHWECDCEACENCRQRRCICPLDAYLDEDGIYKTAWEFAKMVLDDKQLTSLKKTLRGLRGNYPSYTIEIIARTKSLYGPSYPKYKKIAKELFQL